jgi:hypothetical protein
MNTTLTIPDDTSEAWQYRLNQFNAGSGQPPVDLTQFLQLQLDDQTASNVAAYNAYNLRNLTALGEKYLAAPDSVKQQVDEALEPYSLDA